MKIENLISDPVIVSQKNLTCAPIDIYNEWTVRYHDYLPAIIYIIR